MPRDGSGIYVKPFPDVVEGTTIESTVHNGEISDIEYDLNSPRPIVAGGTGANNAHDALINLSGEETGQHVTNYDTFPFVPGSFWSGGGSTGEPVAGHGMAGICYQYGSTGGGYLVLEARDVNDTVVPGRVYVRQQIGGGWGAWYQQAGSTADLDAVYVNVTGDTMTGPLAINAGLRVGTVNPANTYPIVIRAAADYNLNFIQDGTSLGLYAVNDLANAQVPIKISTSIASTSPTTGALTVAGGVGIGGTVQVGGGTIYFGSSGTKSLGYDGTMFQLNAKLNVQADLDAGNIQCAASASTGTLKFGNSGTKYLNYDGTNFNAIGGGFVVGTAPSGSDIAVGGGYLCKNGWSGGYNSQRFNFSYSGPVNMWIDSTNIGVVTITSDYRIKKDVIDLPGMWDTVKALRPIKYTQAQFSPPSHIKHIATETLMARKEAEDNPAAKPREVSTAPLYEADNIERWGFIAHELQETLTSSAASGVKDAPDTIQSPNPFTLIAALTKALQEAMARIEALEAAP